MVAHERDVLQQAPDIGVQAAAPLGRIACQRPAAEVAAFVEVHAAARLLGHVARGHAVDNQSAPQELGTSAPQRTVGMQ